MRRNNSHSLILSGLFAVATLFAGCGFNGGDKTLEEVVEQTYPVDPTATLRITNGDGSIRIYGADITEIKIEAIKKAYSAKRLAGISVKVSARSNSVSIETDFPPAKKWGFGDRSGTVDYVLVVPQTCRITNLELTNGEVLVDGVRGAITNARLTNGRLFGHNCFSNIDLGVASGNLDVAYDWWEETKFSINAKIEDGNLRASIPSDAAFHLIAETEEGKIANDFAEQEQRQDGVRKIDINIGAPPHPEIRLRARDGNIHVVETNR
jgi:hypothetical protein